MAVMLAGGSTERICELGAVLGSVQIAEDPILFADNRDINQAQFLAGFDDDADFGESCPDGVFACRKECHTPQKRWPHRSDARCSDLTLAIHRAISDPVKIASIDFLDLI